MKASSDVPLEVNESNVYNFQVMACDGLTLGCNEQCRCHKHNQGHRQRTWCLLPVIGDRSFRRGSRDKIIVNKIDDLLAEKNGHPTLPLVEISNSRIKLNQ
ncbi:hypothetical protein D5086_027696 [Populus alba]|uniref:Uncharacterized protein n=1 Tax=Populus alba TaxID=43335 RepID=A0ACC4AW44_POPAL